MRYFQCFRHWRNLCAYLHRRIAPSHASSPRRACTMRILIVDDDKGLLEIMSILLKSKGHDVVLAEDGKMAREVVEMEKVDLIISDIAMPTLDGNRFHSYVREVIGATDIPFIFYSAYVVEETQRIVNGSTVDFYLSKADPVKDIVELIEKIRASAERAESYAEQ